MDYLTQQFIATAKKIRDDLHCIAEELHKQTEAAQKQDNTAVSQEHTAPVIHELHVLDTTIDRIKAKSAEDKRHEKFKDRVEIATLGIVLAYTIITGYSWLELHFQNINQSAANLNGGATADRNLWQVGNQFRIQQRAWVSAYPNISINQFVVNPWPSVISGISKNKSFGFEVPIRNTGATPTRDMFDHAWVKSYVGDLPKGFDFRDFQEPRPGILGPGETTWYATDDIPINEILAIQHDAGFNYFSEERKHKHRLYIYGWIRYKDVFGNEVHVTKFCYEMEPNVGADWTIFRDPPWIANYRKYERHNCMDEECNEEERK